MSVIDKKSETTMPERRRDERVTINLPFLLSDTAQSVQWHGTTRDLSSTGMLISLDSTPAPEEGTIVTVAVQGPAETGWERINTRTMRVVRSDVAITALTYMDLD